MVDYEFGTYGVVPPEAMESGPTNVSAATDAYALGCAVFQIAVREDAI